MADDSGTEKPSTPPEVVVCNKRILWAVGVALIVVVVALIVVLWKVPQRQVEHVQGLESKEWFDLVNKARTTLAQILTGIVVLVGGFATLVGAFAAWRNLKVLQQGQITDRFTKAIDQLGAIDDEGEKKLEVRLGGIYALARIAHDSKRDHWPIMEVLCTYVREDAPRTLIPHPKPEVKPPGVDQPQAKQSRPSADIQAILTVLGRRNRSYDEPNQTLDLTEAHLPGAMLYKADLRRAILYKADLRGAMLYKVDLRGAMLYEANLREASLSGADLSGAILIGADLSMAHLSKADSLIWADLSGADLSGAGLLGADLSMAHLSKANLIGADLEHARNLTQEQIETANGDSTTKLPTNLHMPESWK